MGSCDGQVAMRALLRAGARVRRDGDRVSFRWLRGAPTHVLADLLGELRADGWELRRTTTSPGGERAAYPCTAAARPTSRGQRAPSGEDTVSAHAVVRAELAHHLSMPGLAASDVLEALNDAGYLILTTNEVGAMTGVRS